MFQAFSERGHFLILSLSSPKNFFWMLPNPNVYFLSKGDYKDLLYLVFLNGHTGQYFVLVLGAPILPR